jgi:hypothetical protein
MRATLRILALLFAALVAGRAGEMHPSLPLPVIPDCLGVIHYPIKWDSIFLLDNVSRQPVEGEIYLSAPTLIY